MNKLVSSASRATRRLQWAGALAACSLLAAGAAVAQTTFGSSPTIVFPVMASTSTFVGQATLYNPGSSSITVHLNYFDSSSTATPGAKPCTDATIPANSSVQFSLATQCTLGGGSHFGVLVATDSLNTNQFYGYSRTQNFAGAGFSIEGFPVTNFSTVTSNSTGLIRQAASPTYQTNCFAGSLADPVSFNLKLFDGATGAQIGSTISGSLNAFDQIRYLDVFTAAGAPVGDYSNVRAEFSNAGVGNQVLIGFCTVQDNVSFGADFRIAKSPTPPLVPLSSTPWGGAIPTIPSGTGGFIFAGPTATVVLAGPGTLNAYGSASFSRVSGPTVQPTVGVCYQNQSGPGPVTTMGTTQAVSVSTDLLSFGAAGSAAVVAGTYNVGYCVQNNSAGSLNRNDNTSGFVIVSP